MTMIDFNAEHSSFRVTITKADMSVYDESEWSRLKDIFNGIFEFINQSGWKEGYRNTMAVDLLITAEELGIIHSDANHLLHADILISKLIDDGKMRLEDQIDFTDRKNIIKSYLGKWHGDAFAYLIDEDQFESICPSTKKPLELVFAEDAL